MWLSVTSREGSCDPRCRQGAECSPQGTRSHRPPLTRVLLLKPVSRVSRAWDRPGRGLWSVALPLSRTPGAGPCSQRGPSAAEQHSADAPGGRRPCRFQATLLTHRAALSGGTAAPAAAGACVRAWGTWGPASCAVQRWHCARCLAPAPHSRPGAPRPRPVPAAAAPLASPASSACAGLSGRHPPGCRSLWLLAATPVWLLRAHGIRTAHPHHPASPYFRVPNLNFICRSPFACHVGPPQEWARAGDGVDTGV